MSWLLPASSGIGTFLLSLLILLPLHYFYRLLLSNQLIFASWTQLNRSCPSVQTILCCRQQNVTNFWFCNLPSSEGFICHIFDVQL